MFLDFDQDELDDPDLTNNKKVEVKNNINN
jgi:hypothetical protein